MSTPPVSVTPRPNTWTCECGNVNDDKYYNHRVITCAQGTGAFGGESGYDTKICLKCGSEKPYGRTYYDTTRTPEKEVSPTPTPSIPVEEK